MQNSQTSPKSKQRLDAQTRRRQITEVASQLFIENGFEGVTMADIAKELNTSRPNVYVYFPSTESIIEKIIDSHVAAVFSHLDEQLALEPHNADITRETNSASIANTPHLDGTANTTLTSADKFFKATQILLENKELFLLLKSGGGKFFVQKRRSVQEDIFLRVLQHVDQKIAAKKPSTVALLKSSFFGLITYCVADEVNATAEEVSAHVYNFMLGGIGNLR